MHGKTIAVCGGRDMGWSQTGMEVQEEQGAGVAAGDSYCLPMSVTAENQPAINMLHSGAVAEGVAGSRHEAGAGSRLAE